MQATLQLDSSLLVVIREEVRAVLAEQRAEDLSPWLNTAGAAEYLATTEDAIRGMVKRGQLPVHRTETGRLLFRRDELDEHAVAGDVV